MRKDMRYHNTEATMPRGLKLLETPELMYAEYRKLRKGAAYPVELFVDAGDVALDNGAGCSRYS